MRSVFFRPRHTNSGVFGQRAEEKFKRKRRGNPVSNGRATPPDMQRVKMASVSRRRERRDVPGCPRTFSRWDAGMLAGSSWFLCSGVTTPILLRKSLALSICQNAFTITKQRKRKKRGEREERRDHAKIERRSRQVARASRRLRERHRITSAQPKWWTTLSSAESRFAPLGSVFLDPIRWMSDPRWLCRWLVQINPEILSAPWGETVGYSVRPEQHASLSEWTFRTASAPHDSTLMCAIIRARPRVCTSTTTLRVKRALSGRRRSPSTSWMDP